MAESCWFAAANIGVAPYWVLALGSAPPRTRSLHSSGLAPSFVVEPFAATWSGVHPRNPFALGLAPCFRRTAVERRRAWSAALWSGVLPWLSVTLGLIPASISASHTSAWSY